MNPAPEFSDWPFVFVLEQPEDEQAEAAFWLRWLEHWQPRPEWLQ